MADRKIPAAAELCARLCETPHDSIPQLYEKMTHATAALPSVGLESVVPFAQAYGELTGRAERALQAGMFTDVSTTERLATNFASLYFDAITTHLTGDQDAVPVSWRQLFHADRRQQPWLNLALGVNAHIGHDLPLALQASAVQSDYGDNFFGLNKAIKGIAPDLAPGFFPKVPNKLRIGIAAVSANVIIRWRRQAWHDFMHLNTGVKKRHEVAHAAARRGRLLQKVSRGLGATGLMNM